MDEQRIKGLMGLCVRAGQAVFGEEWCLRAMREKKAALLLIDSSISKSTRSKYEVLGKRIKVPVIMLKPGMLGESTGHPGRVMAIRPGSLADQIIHCLESSGQRVDT